jgi:hypothetical protein
MWFCIVAVFFVMTMPVSLAESVFYVKTDTDYPSGSCIYDGDHYITTRNYPDHYENGDGCVVEMNSPGVLNVTAFATGDSCNDFITIKSSGDIYCGYYGPNLVVVDVGSKIDWSTGSQGTDMGWKIGLVSMSTPFTVSNTVVGSCELSGTFVQSRNYPAPYSNGDSCTVTVNYVGALRVVSFSTAPTDGLIIPDMSLLYSGDSGPEGVNMYPGLPFIWETNSFESAMYSGWRLELGTPCGDKTVCKGTSKDEYVFEYKPIIVMLIAISMLAICAVAVRRGLIVYLAGKFGAICSKCCKNEKTLNLTPGSSDMDASLLPVVDAVEIKGS